MREVAIDGAGKGKLRVESEELRVGKKVERRGGGEERNW